jgi:predicted Abi (CAAX) family protease
MKLKSWQLGAFLAIGIWLSWWCHSIRIESLFQNSSLIQVIANPKNPSFQPISSNINQPNYSSNGEWIGRLILPTPVQINSSTLTDWVWIEIKRTPVNNQQLIGKTIKLTWQPKSSIATDVRQVITDIKFTPETIASQQQGNIHPQRLNGRSAVGALQSLAGSRAVDDVLVKLTGATITADLESGSPMVTVDREPTQITGTLIGLVKILGTNKTQTPQLPSDCNQSKCLNEYFDVQHYNPISREFDGEINRIRIPQVPAKKSGLLPSTIQNLERSPAGRQGWYIYGDRDVSGLFVVSALQPRALFMLTPQREIIDTNQKLDYFNHQHWQNTAQKQGELSQVKFIDATTRQEQLEKIGTKALTIHSFGGIGGKTGDDLGIWQTVTGHFAYGLATVTRSTFTNQLEWSIDYNQIYAHNPDGIVAGKQDWATYMGDLQRGWLATRPVSDLLISYPPVTEDYDFGGIKLSPLTELQRQLQIFGARYRTGDGTGSASVTPATSCVQDANQALYVTIQQLNRQVRSQPQIQAWIATHPQHPQTLRFRELQSLGTDLATTLAPLGIVRQDWQQNAAKLAGIQTDRGFTSSSNPIAGLISWQTMLPRGAQDGIAKIFSKHGATIWFLNTYQVGGVNPDIFPITPTVVFGQFPLLSILVIRLWAGIVNFPNLTGWLLIFGLLVGYGIVALLIGFKTRFLTLSSLEKFTSGGLWVNIRSIVQLFFLPALVEEIGFRLLLIPHPIETAISSDIYLWSIGSLILFTIYHPLNAWTLYKLGNPTFMDWRFLLLTSLLGLVCSIGYLITGSIWSAVLIHWLVVSSWLKLFGGEQLLDRKQPPNLVEKSGG